MGYEPRGQLCRTDPHTRLTAAPVTLPSVPWLRNSMGDLHATAVRDIDPAEAQNDRAAPPDQFGVTVFAGITVPVYDGGMRAAVLEQVRARADNASLALTRTREEAVRQIVLARNGLRTSLSAYSASTSLTAAVGALGSAPQ